MAEKKQAKPKLKLVGEDGNAYAIMARGADALRRAGRSGEVAEYMEQSMAGDYDHLLAVQMRWFDVR